MSRSRACNGLLQPFYRGLRLGLDSTTRPVSRFSATGPSLTRPERRSPSFGTRHYATESRIPTSRSQQRRRSPVLTTLVLLTTFAAGSIIALKIYDRYYGKKSAFPPEVEEKLRQAIYHSEIVNEPALSYKEFREALEIADSIGIDQWSDPYLGIKIRMTEMLEKHGMYSEAVGLYLDMGFEFHMYYMKEMVHLGLISVDTWENLPPELQSCRAEVASDLLQQPERPPALIAIMDEASKSILSGKKGDFSNDTPSQQARRQRVFRLWMGSLNNLALLFLKFRDFDNATEMFQTILSYDRVLPQQMLPLYDAKEALLSYREKAAIWSSNGVACYCSGTRATEALHSWNRALHIFRDLNGDKPTCEEVTMLSSIGLARAGVSGNYGIDISKIATTSPSSTSSSFPTPSEAPQMLEGSIYPLSPTELQKEKDDALNAARNFVLTAYRLSKTIQPPIRTPECDDACLGATMHLASFAEEVGNFALARERSLEAKALAQQILSSRNTRSMPQRSDSGSGEMLGKSGVLETALRTLRGAPVVRGQAGEKDGNTAGGGAAGSASSDLTASGLARLIDECDDRIRKLDEKIAAET